MTAEEYRNLALEILKHLHTAQFHIGQVENCKMILCLNYWEKLNA